MNDSSRTDRSRSDARRREELGYRSRTERRTARRAARRREVTTKMWRAIIPVLAAIAITVILLVVLGGSEDRDPAQSTVTTLAQPPREGSGLLVVKQDGGAPELLLMHPTGGSGVVMAMPGITLLKTAGGFKTLEELHASGDTDMLRAALAEAVGVAVGPVASTEWADLREAMTSAGVADIPAVALSPLGAEAELVAAAALEFLVAAASQPDGAAFKSLDLGGEADGFRSAVGANEGTMTGGWTSAALTGSVVEGIGFEYLEPDVDRARALLGGSSRESTVRVEVQNGSGVIGVAEQASGLLQSLGYTMLPVSNAGDFPDVIETRIAVAPDVAADGEAIRAALGVGEILEDDSLQPGYVLVVLGADFAPPPPVETGPSG